ncbi:hypothetical protein [Gimesia aquarii]|uniref:Uncharacterized protein n=1 Tax=Gimesia aquarii TaxID=2527964 RepID=A0A517WV82_9PLAN|nr:hypothetical protein [Gimesia aquarii]QDU09161.1 hypothetical protein V202x_25330 [Gimesia aquarii]
MSTASKSSQSTEHRTEHYAKFDEYVDYQISKTSSNIKANDLLTTAVGISTILLGYLLVFVVFDHWFVKGGFGYIPRLLMLAGVVLACLGWAVWKLVLPYFKKVTQLYSAHSLEQTSDKMEGSLLNLIDLKKSERPVNPAIINSLEKKAALTLSKTDTDQAIDRRPLMRLSYALLGVVTLLCFYALFSPKEIWPSLSAAMSFSTQREFATQTQINSVTPGNTEVLSGSQLEVIVDLRGEVPEKVTLFYTSNDQGSVDEPVTLRSMDDTLKRYQGVIVGVNGRGIRQELTYHIEAGDAVSEDFQVKVIQPPSATVHSVRYEYPKYMELSSVEQPGGAIDAWEGTKVTVDATTNMPISSFEVLFSDEENSKSLLEEFKIEKTIKDNTITASWKLKLRADGSFPNFYQIKCRNEAGQTTLSPTVYPLVIRPDLPPEISLLSPKRDLKMPANGTIPISVIAEDPDFKIRYLNLRVDKEQIRVLDKTLFEGAQKSVDLTHDFELKPLRLTPGETVFLWVEARDNKQPSGNRKNTPKIKVEILEPVSKEEAQKQLQEQKQETAQENKKQSSNQKNQTEKGKGGDPQSGKGSSSKMKSGQSEGNKSEKSTEEGNKSKQGTDQDNQDKKEKQQSDSENPQRSNEPSTKQNNQKSEDKKGLDSTGKDDQEAIKKILEQLKKEGKQPDSDSKPEQPDTEKSDSKNSSSDPNTQDQNSSKQTQTPNQSPSKSSDHSKGTPDAKGSENKNSSAQPSSKGNEPDNDPKTKPNQKQSDQPLKGKKEPAPPSDNAMKSKSDGNTKGKATPNHDPDAKPEKSSNDIQRDPKEKPALRPGKKDNPDSPKNKRDSQTPKENTSPGKASPSSENKPQKGMRKPENSNQNPSPSKEQEQSNGTDNKKKQDQVDGANTPPKGKNKPTEQKSKRPQDGENGNSSQNDQGQKGSKQSGKGDSTGQKGNQEQGTQKNSSGSKQPMNNQKSSQGKGSSQKNNQSGSGKKGADSKGKGGASQGKGQSKPGSKPGQGSSAGSKTDNPKGSSATSGGRASGDGNEKTGAGNDSSLPEAEDANLEYGKEAANLVLKRIKDELKRKEVNQELLDELGWSKEEMKRFSERLQKQLQSPDAKQQTPESLARKRQFEEMLKSLKPTSRAAQRNRTSTRKQTNDSLGPRRLPVPEEYREAYEAFTRGLSEKQSSGK